MRYFSKTVSQLLLLSAVLAATVTYRLSAARDARSAVQPVAAAPDARAKMPELSRRSPPLPRPRVLIDINHATKTTLETLPGIGPKLSDVILEDIRNNGPFESANDLLRVQGIGKGKLTRIAPLVKFQP